MSSNRPAQGNRIQGMSRHDVVERTDSAAAVPFILRAWWLRDRVEYDDLKFAEIDASTGPLWCLHSDPLCDAGNLDTFF